MAWRYHWDGARWKKPPLDPATGRAASSTDPATWGRLADAYRLYTDGAAHGVGYVPAGGGPVGIDLDGCRDPESGRLQPWAAELIARLDTYAELSPSGSGLRAFALGELPADSIRRGGIELYQRRQYVTVTGHRLPGAPPAVRDRRAELLELYRRLEAEKQTALRPAPPVRPPRDWPAPAGAGDLGDEELIRRAEGAANGALFSRLWRGDASGYTSPSEADLALVRLLAFWCGGDGHHMDALFRQSGLMRPKWDAACGSTTYGGWTIAKALRDQTAFYRPGVAHQGAVLALAGEHRNEPTAQTEVLHGGGGSLQTEDSDCITSVCAVDVPVGTIPRCAAAVERCLFALARHTRADPATADADVSDLKPTVAHWVAVSRPFVLSLTVAGAWPLFCRGWERVRYLPGDGPLDRLFAASRARPDSDLVAHFAGLPHKWARNPNLPVVATFCRRAGRSSGGRFYLGYVRLTELVGKKSWHVGRNLLWRLWKDAGCVRRERRGTTTSGASEWHWVFQAVGGQEEGEQ